MSARLDQLPPAQIDALLKDKTARIHFVGIGGTGMSAYADFRALSGGRVSGSDRGFDQGKSIHQRDGFVARGITIHPQDGSGVAGAAAVVVSATIEDTVPDFRAAIEAGLPIISRKAWLSAHYRSFPTIAITGTSGKSSATAMVFETLRGAGLDPSLISGAELRSLLALGLPGNAYFGTGPLVIEADESDKGITDYQPEVGVILNLQRDHDEPAAMLPAFAAFKANCRKACIVSDDPALSSLHAGAIVVGGADQASRRITDIDLHRDYSRFVYDGTPISLPVPGAHNVQNAAMALAVADVMGVDRVRAAMALGAYQGVARRFEIVRAGRGIEVVDDYAHNPAKIAAVIQTAAQRSTRTLLYFQPHGFGPTRFLRPDLVEMFAQSLRPQDELYFAPIYYAGGTVAKDISSQDLINDLRAKGRIAHYVPTQIDFINRMKDEAQAGDCIVIVGGRDPMLSAFARELAGAVIGA